jgi:NAD+ kinase
MNYCIIIRDNDESLKIKQEIMNRINHNYDEKNPDFVVAIGGDGTIIKASHTYPNAIIFGIHSGHLGYYANYSSNDIDILVDDINNGSFKVENVDLLSAEFVTKSGNIVNDIALNEVTIVSPLRTLMLDIYIDNSYLERFRGTGVCISTPTGSTAYNKSLHGSVVDTKLKIMQMTEIAGINSNAYRTLSSPLVLSSDRRIKLDLVDGHEKKNDVFITVDHISYSIKDLKCLYIFYDNKKMKMAYNKPEEFINRISRSFLISKK